VLERAIHNYFAYQQRQSQRRFRLLVRDGRIALSIGIIFLFVCILIRQIAYSFGSGTVSEIIAEGMLIAGWVAMWRPLEILLYDWWPIRRRTRVFGKLSTIPVVLRTR
jgi:archaellum biogenesis protein FlaJ (TadC family)